MNGIFKVLIAGTFPSSTWHPPNQLGRRVYATWSHSQWWLTAWNCQVKLKRLKLEGPFELIGEKTHQTLYSILYTFICSLYRFSWTAKTVFHMSEIEKTSEADMCYWKLGRWWDLRQLRLAWRCLWLVLCIPWAWYGLPKVPKVNENVDGFHCVYGW